MLKVVMVTSRIPLGFLQLMYKADQGTLCVFFLFFPFFPPHSPAAFLFPSRWEEALAISKTEFNLAHLSSSCCQKQLEEIIKTVYGL